MRVLGVRSIVRRSVARFGVVGLTVTVGLSPTLTQAAQVPGYVWGFSQSDHGGSPATPKQPSGTAAGKAHYVPASATRATSGAKGHPAGKSPYELPADKPHAKTSKPHTSDAPKAATPVATRAVTSAAAGKSSFDATASVRQDRMGNAQTAVFKNPDGTYTARLYPVRTQYQLPDASWAPIDLTLVVGGGRASAPAC